MGEQEIYDELEVEAPVAGIVVDEYGCDLEGGRGVRRGRRRRVVDWKRKGTAGAGRVVGGEGAGEGPDGGMVVVDVGGD